jgi:hypothetical protein
MTDALTHLDYSIDTTTLLESASKARLESKPYTDSRYTDLKLDKWHIGHFTDGCIEVEPVNNSPPKAALKNNSS